MVLTVSITVHADIDEPTQAEIGEGLDAFNKSKVGPDPSRLVWIVARDAAGATVGGIRGIVLWTWFALDWLWVAEDARHQGVGTQLLGRAEQAARDAGCTGAFLNTFSFQAPAFYRRHGYREFGRLENFPQGNTRLWMCKDLT